MILVSFMVIYPHGHLAQCASERERRKEGGMEGGKEG